MRANKGRSPDDIRERYLGEIAPLLAAARNVESLSPVQKRQIRKRVLRTVFGSRSRLLRFRLTPAMVGLGLLVAGGVAFATAERLGFIHRSEQGAPNLKAPDGDAHKRKSPRSKLGVQQGVTRQESASEVAAAVVLPQVPDPLVAAPSLAVVPSERKPTQAPGLAMPARARTASAQDARGPVGVMAPRPWHPQRKLALATPYLAEPVGPTPAMLPPASANRGGALTTPPSAAYPAPAPLPSPSTVVAPAARSQNAAPTSTPAVAPVPQPAKSVASDPVLFGQALRRLRNENDPSAALAALQLHAQAYPHSAFSGERSALEVEALLALHRDREALQKLDGMSLENLPRSGERFVLRGELRAAARRWLDAKEDFEHALSRVSGSPSWHDRALWGRGVARLRCGERQAGMDDIERYHDLYPKGRFAAEAGRFFPTK